MSRPLKAGIFYDSGGRSKRLCEAMWYGIRKTGDQAIMYDVDNYSNKASFDVAVFYGLRGNLMEVYKKCRAIKKPSVLIDLGYWGRLDYGKFEGYHKISVNGLHPDKYFQKYTHDGKRIKKFKLKPKPFNIEEGAILVSGMSEKSAGVYNLRAQEYESAIIKKLRSITDRPIIYRPKPSWKGARPIEGSIFDDGRNTIVEALEGVSIVVTHHSNVVIDALIEGITNFWVVDGVSKQFSNQEINLNHPTKVNDINRQRFLNDLSYTQWSTGEIEKGLAWEHLKKENLV